MVTNESAQLAGMMHTLAKTPEEREFVSRVTAVCRFNQERYLRLSIIDRLYQLRKQYDELDDAVRRILNAPKGTDAEHFQRRENLPDLYPLFAEIEAFIEISKTGTEKDGAQASFVKPLYSE